MAVLTTGLPACSFLEDIPDVIFSEMRTTASVSVTFNGTVILSDAKMTPDAKGQIILYMKQMIRNMVVLAKPEPCTKKLPQLIVKATLSDGGELSTTGYVIPGRTAGRSAINMEWFTENFLTWQPQIIETTPSQPQWLAWIPFPNFAQYEILSTLYTMEGQTFTRTLFNCESGPDYRQFRTDYDYLWKSFCTDRGLEPYCYDVFGRGYRVVINNMAAAESESGDTRELQVVAPNKPFAQRYILRPDRYNDMCLGFENTLGGFDTITLEGKTTYQPEGEITTIRTYTAENELDNDYTSIWEATTGRLETERAATQFQDFFKSTNRFIFLKGTWRRIIVTEYKVKHYRGESNSYTFKYHLADKNEGRYFNRGQLPEVELPTVF